MSFARAGCVQKYFLYRAVACLAFVHWGDSIHDSHAAVTALAFGRTFGRRNDAGKICFRMLRRLDADLNTVEALPGGRSFGAVASRLPPFKARRTTDHEGFGCLLEGCDEEFGVGRPA